MRKCLVMIFMLVASVTAIAQPRPHNVDKAHSQINFVAEARFLSAKGFFDKWEAEVLLDPAKPETSSFKITIDAASINTRVQQRDNHLRSADFFDVAKFPQITMVSKKITRVADGKFTVTVDLTIHGVTKQMDVPLTQVFYENNRGRYRSNFEINRREFGIVYNSRLNPIEDTVKVEVDINVQIPPPPKPATSN
ncbi:MAG: YceI family protein [Acidobacteriota bacterium]